MEAKKYKPQMGIFWWTTRWWSIKFISRELTSVAVGFYAILFLFYVRAVLHGPDAYSSFSEKLKSPLSITFNILVLICLIFHSVTWFNLAPKAMVIKIGENKIPGFLVALANYAGWFFISLAILWLVIN